MNEPAYCAIAPVKRSTLDTTNGAFTSIASTATSCNAFTWNAVTASQVYEITCAPLASYINPEGRYSTNQVSKLCYRKNDILWRQLKDLPRSKNWNGYNALPPNEIALDNATRLLEMACDMHIVPTRIDPSSEGGVVLSYWKDSRYCDIECFNSGEIIGLKHNSSEGDPTTCELENDDGNFEQALESIREFINANNSR